MSFLPKLQVQFCNFGGNMAQRTESLTIRMNPRTKYLAQLAATQNGMTLSSLIDSSLLRALERTRITYAGETIALSKIADQLWAEHEADRIVLLADNFPFLLTPQQEEMWEVIQATQKYWRVSLSNGEWNVSQATFNFEALRQDWLALNTTVKE
jgi:hypothetical protein